MNILIDIGHPAHVHLLRNLYKLLVRDGRNVIVTIKNNLNSARELLAYFDIPYITIGSKSDSLLSKAIKQINYNLKITKLVREYNIGLGIGTSINLAHASRLSRMKSIVLDDDDDDVQPLMTKFGHPFAHVVLSPSAVGSRKKKQTIFYDGYHELAYLHPNRFAPDASVLNEAGLQQGEKYFILRFNSFKAHHDIGIQGLSLENKRKLVERLSGFGKVFITTERETEPEFEKYKISIPPHKIHSFIAYSTMLIGDSQTMTSEASVLGVPAIRSNSFVGKISYLEEEEKKYGLTYGFKPDEAEKMFEKINELLIMPDLKEVWQKKRERMLGDKIDITAFLQWFVENYPGSVREMRENPRYQNRFKTDMNFYKALKS